MERQVLLCLVICTAGCAPDHVSRQAPESFSAHLKPASGAVADSAIRRTVYVPVYSSIYWGVNPGRDLVDLAATVSVRNVSGLHPLIIHYVRYYDSGGKQVREYIKQPVELPPLASVEFVIAQRDRTGGPGANFLVQWSGTADMDEPLIEAVMVGQSGNAGLSFTSQGRTIRNEPPK